MEQGYRGHLQKIDASALMALQPLIVEKKKWRESAKKVWFHRMFRSG